MSMIIDSRQTYFDAEGNRLSGGRLRFFIWGTTTPATVYSDIEHTTPIIGTIQLTSAGWAPFEIYSSQDLDVRADKFIGLDEYGVESYSEVKSFRYFPPAITGGGSTSISTAIVPSVQDLRALSTSFDVGIVLGYHSAGDCPTRMFLKNTSSAYDNGGTVIASSSSPTTRWIWTPEAHVDCRTFGVIASPATTVNSQFTSCVNAAQAAGWTVSIPAGDYKLTTGALAVGATLDVAEGAVLTCPSGTYTLTLHSADSTIRSTLAGTGVSLQLAGDSWQSAPPVPRTAWNASSAGMDAGLSSPNIVISGASASISASCSFTEITMFGACSLDVAAGATVTARELKGTGTLATPTNPVVFRRLRTSNLADRSGTGYRTAMQAAHLVVDADLHIGAINQAFAGYVEFAGAKITSVSGASSAFVSATHGYGGTPNGWNCSLGVNVGYAEIKQDFFASAECLVRSWNVSNQAAGGLDLGGASSSVGITRSGRISNGTVPSISCQSAILTGVTVTGNTAVVVLNANGCSFANMTANSSALTSCSINNSVAVAAANSRWENISVSGDVTVVGGDASWRDVTLRNATLVPSSANGYFANFRWVGGSAAGIVFDASQGALLNHASNVTITGLAYVTNNIVATSSTIQAWDSTGHSRINISDNVGARCTRGSKTVTGTLYSSSNGWSNYDLVDLPLFKFSTNSVEQMSSCVAVCNSIYDGNMARTNYTGWLVRDDRRMKVGVTVYGLSGWQAPGYQTIKIALTWDVYGE